MVATVIRGKPQTWAVEQDIVLIRHLQAELEPTYQKTRLDRPAYGPSPDVCGSDSDGILAYTDAWSSITIMDLRSSERLLTESTGQGEPRCRTAVALHTTHVAHQHSKGKKRRQIMANRTAEQFGLPIEGNMRNRQGQIERRKQSAVVR